MVCCCDLTGVSHCVLELKMFSSSVVCTDLIQRPHRNLCDVVRDELPGGALRVAGGEALSVPQVT